VGLIIEFSTAIYKEKKAVTLSVGRDKIISLSNLIIFESDVVIGNVITACEVLFYVKYTHWNDI
jgi:hypothetical protein